MNEYFEMAFKEAKKAYKKNEIPVGAIIVKNKNIIAKGHNNRQKKYNLLGHAEIISILKAERRNKDWRLDDCEMYVTLEPCDMCKMLIKESRIKKVYYLIKQEKNSSKNNNIMQTNDCINIKTKYQELLNNFFKKLRD